MVTLAEKEESGYQLQYKKGLEEWKNYTEPFEVTEYNTVIVARLIDTSTQTPGDSTATYTVTNIDTLKPNEFNLIASSQETTITVSAEGTVTDAEATNTSGSSNIVKYEYKLNNGEWVTPNPATNTSYTFTGLTGETNYTVSMRAYDEANNVREATNKEYSIRTADIPMYTLTVANGTIDETGMTSGIYKKGTEVSITATIPEEITETTWSGQTAEVQGNIRYHVKHTYSLSSWSNGDTTATTTVTVNEDTTMTANITDNTLQVDKQKYDNYQEYTIETYQDYPSSLKINGTSITKKPSTTSITPCSVSSLSFTNGEKATKNQATYEVIRSASQNQLKITYQITAQDNTGELSVTVYDPVTNAVVGSVEINCTSSDWKESKTINISKVDKTRKVWYEELHWKDI